MKKFYLLIVVLISVNVRVNASNLDSLKQLLPQLKNEILVDAYLEVAAYSFTENNQLDSMISYSLIALEKSKEIKYVPGIINSLTYAGIGYTKSGDIETSNKYWNQALTISIAVKDYVSIADLESKIGYNYHITDNYEQAIIHYLKAADVMEDLNNYIGMSSTYVNVAMLFSVQKQYEECLLYLRKALSTATKLKDPYDQVLLYSGVMVEMIDIAQESPNYLDSALVYASKGLPIAVKNNFHSKAGLFYLELSGIYANKKELEKSTEYFLKSRIYRSYFSEIVLVRFYLRASDYYKEKNNLPLSLQYIDSASAVLGKNTKDYYGLLVAEKSYQLNKSLGNYLKALESHERLRVFESTFFNQERNKQLNELQQRFNKVQNEKTITELGQEKKLLEKNKQIDGLKINLLVAGTILLAFIIILIVLLFYQRSVNQKKKVLEAELRLNRTRMNPHFFFNALSSIQTLSLQADKSELISRYISKFSKIMRASLENSYNDLITLEEEIEFIRNYLEIQEFYLDHKFSYQITKTDTMATSEYLIPPMLLQPFIENSIEHGFKNMKANGKIEIDFRIRENQLYISITDNGLGVTESDSSKKYPSRATQIIQDRLFLLNKQKGSKASYSIRPNNPIGTMVEIFLPLISEK